MPKYWRISDRAIRNGKPSGTDQGPLSYWTAEGLASDGTIAWQKSYKKDFGGKSGTAEDVGTQQHVLFVAYSPQAAPRAVAAVVLDEGQSGSVEAGPIARDLVLTAIK